jgi:hypothetical protein
MRQITYFGSFVLALFRHWAALMTGGIACALLLVYERFTGASLSPRTFWWIVAVAFFAACFQAWKAERKVAETVAAPDMAFTWNWQYPSLGAVDYEKDMILHNRSTAFIYSIRISPVSLDSELSFDPINEIEPDGKLPVTAHWNQVSSSTAPVYVQYLLKNGKAAHEKGWVVPCSVGLDSELYRIPLTVEFEAGGFRWQRDAVFEYRISGRGAFEHRPTTRIH